MSTLSDIAKEIGISKRVLQEDKQISSSTIPEAKQAIKHPYLDARADDPDLVASTDQAPLKMRGKRVCTKGNLRKLQKRDLCRGVH